MVKSIQQSGFIKVEGMAICNKSASEIGDEQPKRSTNTKSNIHKIRKDKKEKSYG